MKVVQVVAHQEPRGNRIQGEAELGQEEPRLLSNIDKARRVFGYEPKTDFKEGLGNTYNWFTENWDNIKKSAEF